MWQLARIIAFADPAHNHDAEPDPLGEHIGRFVWTEGPPAVRTNPVNEATVARGIIVNLANGDELAPDVAMCACRLELLGTFRDGVALVDLESWRAHHVEAATALDAV